MSLSHCDRGPTIWTCCIEIRIIRKNYKSHRINVKWIFFFDNFFSKKKIIFKMGKCDEWKILFTMNSLLFCVSCPLLCCCWMKQKKNVHFSLKLMKLSYRIVFCFVHFTRWEYLNICEFIQLKICTACTSVFKGMERKSFSLFFGCRKNENFSVFVFFHPLKKGILFSSQLTKSTFGNNSSVLWMWIRSWRTFFHSVFACFSFFQMSARLNFDFTIFFLKTKFFSLVEMVTWLREWWWW